LRTSTARDPTGGPSAAVVEAGVGAVEHGERPEDDDEGDHEQCHAFIIGILLY
jgi:hypothetical protein